jgi:hypothetical protein
VGTRRAGSKRRPGRRVQGGRLKAKVLFDLNAEASPLVGEPGQDRGYEGPGTIGFTRMR